MKKIIMDTEDVLIEEEKKIAKLKKKSAKKKNNKKKYRLYVGVYESITNAQAEFISDKPIFLGLRALEGFLEKKFHNFSKITFISTEKNVWIDCKKLSYKEFEKFSDKEEYN